MKISFLVLWPRNEIKRTVKETNLMRRENQIEKIKNGRWCYFGAMMR